MKHRILVNNVLEDDIDAPTPMQACARYIEERIPHGHAVHLRGGHLVGLEVAVIKTVEYTVEARAVPEGIPV